MFHPFPAEVSRHGFETISDALADRIHDEADHTVPHYWGNVIMSGERECLLTFTIAEPGPEAAFGGKMRPSLINATLHDFQGDIAVLVAECGFQGYIRAERHLNVMRHADEDDES
jgi:hypothetical protein